MFRSQPFIAYLVICSALLLSDFFYDKHAQYPPEQLFGWYALAGLLGSVALVLMGRLVGWVVRREEDYYDR